MDDTKYKVLLIEDDKIDRKYFTACIVPANRFKEPGWDLLLLNKS